MSPIAWGAVVVLLVLGVFGIKALLKRLPAEKRGYEDEMKRRQPKTP